MVHRWERLPSSRLRGLPCAHRGTTTGNRAAAGRLSRTSQQDSCPVLEELILARSTSDFQQCRNDVDDMAWVHADLASGLNSIGP